MSTSARIVPLASTLWIVDLEMSPHACRVPKECTQVSSEQLAVLFVMEELTRIAAVRLHVVPRGGVPRARERVPLLPENWPDHIPKVMPHGMVGDVGCVVLVNATRPHIALMLLV